MRALLFVTLAAFATTSVATPVQLSKLPTGPIGKIEPNKHPNLKVGPQPFGAGTVFAKDIQYVQGPQTVLNPDGSYDIGTKVVAVISTPAGPGVLQATSLRVDRADVIICQGGVPPLTYQPLFPSPYPGALKAGNFVATIPITMDLFNIEAKCPIGQPDSATITLTISATTNAGTTATDTLVMHMNHFDN